LQVWVNDELIDVSPDESDYFRLDRDWRSGDRVRIEFAMPARAMADRDGNTGKVAFVRGPLVFAADVADLPPNRLLDDVIVALDPVAPGSSIAADASSDADQVNLTVNLASIESGLGDGFWSVPERYQEVTAGGKVTVDGSMRLIPFFLAGNRHAKSFRDEIASAREPVIDVTFQVWLPYVSSEG
jgi:DUF1680 family protein